MIEELRELTDEEIAAIPMAMDDDEADAGDPDVFTLFDPIYEVALNGRWYTESGSNTLRLLKTRTNDVVFLGNLYNDSYSAADEDPAFSLPESLRAGVEIKIPLVCEERPEGLAYHGYMKITEFGNAYLYQFDDSDSVWFNTVRAAGVSYNMSSALYLKE